MEHDEMITVETILLPDENGVEMEYAILDDFEFEGKAYMIVAAVEGDMIDDETKELLTYREEGEDLILDSIEDEAEFQRVVDFYNSLPEEEGECGCGCGDNCDCE